jgi:hypothetical protein
MELPVTQSPSFVSVWTTRSKLACVVRTQRGKFRVYSSVVIDYRHGGCLSAVILLTLARMDAHLGMVSGKAIHRDLLQLNHLESSVPLSRGILSFLNLKHVSARLFIKLRGYPDDAAYVVERQYQLAGWEGNVCHVPVASATPPLTPFGRRISARMMPILWLSPLSKLAHPRPLQM